MVIEQVIGWVLVVQNYFFSFCRYIAINVKKLGSLTFSEISGSSVNGDVGSGKDDLRCIDSSSDSDRKQTKGKVRLKLKPISEIPGPTCLPVLGSLLDFNKFGPRRVHELSKERHEKFGDIFRERLLSQEMVFVANRDLMKQWMSQEGKFPASLKQEPSRVFAELYPQLKRGLFFRNGEEWYRFRKVGHSVVLKNASDFDSHGLFDGCQDFLEKYMTNLREENCKDRNEGFIEDLEIFSYEIAVGAVTHVVFGKKASMIERYTGTSYKTLSKNTKEINESHQKLLETPVRIAKWFNAPAWVDYHTKLSHNLETCLKFSRLLREEIKSDPDICSMKSHGLLYKTMQLNSIPEDVDDLLTDFAVDTKDPLAGTFMFVTQVLGMHPEVQERILEEISLIYPDDQPITYGKLKYMEYTEGFYMEVLRLYPVAAFTARVASEDTVIGEYLIPPGTMLMYSSYVAHRDPRYFSDPEKLIPERWFKYKKMQDEMANGTSKLDNLRCDTKAFAAFGLNQRACLGRYLAISIFIMFIANLVKNFKITSKALPEVEMKTVLYPKNPGPIHLQVRQPILRD